MPSLPISTSERVGFILKDETFIELVNISSAPEHVFEVSPEDMLKYEDKIALTWHTHLRGDANLSAEDYVSFLAWPEYLHVIVFAEDVRGFYVSKGALLADDGKDHPAWGLVRDLAERLSMRSEHSA